MTFEIVGQKWKSVEAVIEIVVAEAEGAYALMIASALNAHSTGDGYAFSAYYVRPKP